MDLDWVVERMAKGAVLKREPDGDFRIGRRRLRREDVELMMAEDLLTALADGRFDLSELGRARAKRTSLGRMRVRASGSVSPACPEDRFRAQHQIRGRRPRSPGDGVGNVIMDLTESPLGWLRRRKNARGDYYLNDRQVEAGERLRRDFESAALSPSVTSAWSGLPVGRGRRAPKDLDPTERQLAARRRFNKAVTAMGSNLADVTVRTCCFLEGLEEVERSQGWPVRSGKVVLRIALDTLADHYGLPPASAGKCTK